MWYDLKLWQSWRPTIVFVPIIALTLSACLQRSIFKPSAIKSGEAMERIAQKKNRQALIHYRMGQIAYSQGNIQQAHHHYALLQLCDLPAAMQPGFAYPPGSRKYKDA